MATPEKGATINLNRQLTLAYWLVMLALYAGAFLYGPAYGSMPQGEWIASCLVLGLFSSIPLFGFVAVAHKPQPGSVSWLSFLILGYLIFGIVLLFKPGDLVAGLAITGTTLNAYVQIIVWLRPFKKAAKEQKAKEERARALKKEKARLDSSLH